MISDAWAPQVNGVVRTLMTTAEQLRADGHEVETITPDQFRTVPCPSYPEIRLALGCGRQVATRGAQNLWRDLTARSDRPCADPRRAR